MVSDDLERIKSELEALGYETWYSKCPRGDMVVFGYEVEVGSYRGREVLIGLSFQEGGYPEYPPHWLSISPPVDDGKGGTVERYCEDGREWVSMSRPPGRMWDELRTKHMHSYLTEFLRGFWYGI